jgi:pimeloyl-ACP methyl ester carboxylesterase
VYAPRYRQTNGRNFIELTADGERAFELAYSDVERAFDAFNARRGETRPFIVAAHSQGTMLAERLIARRISRTPMRERLVAAYLIGGRVTVAGLRAASPDIAVCASATQVRCVVAYNARSVGYVPSRFELTVIDAGPRLCVNPLTWRDDDAIAPASANLGAVFIESDVRSPRPGFADAQCRDGTLWIRSIAKAPRDFMSSQLDRVLGPGNHHSIEFQLYYANLRANAQARVDAMLAERARPSTAPPAPTP